MRTVPGLLWAVRPELPVSACRLWQLALMLHAAGVGAFGLQGLLGARATALSADNCGLRGDLDRHLFGAVPVVNQNVVCPPPCFFWPALPAPALSCQSGSSRRVVSCQKMTQGIGLGMGKRWLQAAEPHHLNSTTCLDIRKAQTLAARRAAVSNPVCAHSSLAATGRRARVPPHTVKFSFNACCCSA